MMRRAPLILGKKTYRDISDDICRLVETLPDTRFLIGLTAALFLFLIYGLAQGSIAAIGMGLMGINHPVGWGTDIVTFVFWIGIGHAGTLISAILFLFRQKWRTSIART